MDTIVKKLIEGRRIDEVRKKDALSALAQALEDRLKQIKGYRKHKLVISPNSDRGCVDVEFEGTGDIFSVYPQKTKISNEKSNKVVKVSDIDGAYIEGTTVYDSEGNVIGEALVRMRAIHNKSDYSTSLEDAEYHFNSKITDLKRLEKYIASEAINNVK